MSRSRISTVLFLLCGFALPTASTAQMPQTPSIDELLRRLGFTEEDKKALIAGEIITADVDRAREDQLIAAVATLLDAPLPNLAKNLRRGLNIEGDPATRAYGILTAEAHGDQLEAISFAEDSEDEVRKLLEVEADGTFNLSTREIERLRSRLGEINRNQPEAARTASRAYQSVLAGRFRAYLQNGLAGIADYDHGGASPEPHRQLRSAHAQVEPFFDEFFPAFGQAVIAYPKAQRAGIENQFYWIKREVEGRPAFILAHQTVMTGNGFVLMSQRQFFVGHTYESLQVYVLALPLETGSALFALSSAFTDQVTGLFSSIAQPVGQSRMKDDLRVMFGHVRSGHDRGR